MFRAVMGPGARVGSAQGHGLPAGPLSRVLRQCPGCGVLLADGRASPTCAWPRCPPPPEPRSPAWHGGLAFLHPFQRQRSAVGHSGPRARTAA